MNFYPVLYMLIYLLEKGKGDFQVHTLVYEYVEGSSSMCLCMYCTVDAIFLLLMGCVEEVQLFWGFFPSPHFARRIPHSRMSLACRSLGLFLTCEGMIIYRWKSSRLRSPELQGVVSGDCFASDT